MRIGRALALVALVTQLGIAAADASEVVIDGITPQTDATVKNYYGLSSNNYGMGFTAGASREIVEIDLIVNPQVTSGNIFAYIYQNSNNGSSGSGTLVGTFTQATNAVAYSGGITGKYLVRLTGSAQLQAGQKYWIYQTAPALQGNAQNAWVYTTPTVSGSWSIVTSGVNYVMTTIYSAFDNDAYPAFKLIASTPTTAVVSLNSGGTKATYRSTTTIKAEVNSNGPVTFYANKKYIPGCKQIQSSAGVALCQWRPSLHGVYALTARVVPTDSANYLPKTSDAMQVTVAKRSNTR